MTILCISLSLLFVACNKTEYKLTYIAGSGGTITGELVQTVEQGQSGGQVVAVADSGYLFAKWSDGVTTPSRIDKNVQKDISVTAEFVQQSTGNGGNSNSGDSGNSNPGDNNPGTSGGGNNPGESGGESGGDNSQEGGNTPDGTEPGGNQPEQTPVVMHSDFVGTWINVGYRVTSLGQPYFHYEGSSGEIGFDRRVVIGADGQLTYTEDKQLQKTKLVGNASENNQDYNFTFKKPVNDDGARWFYLAKRQGDYLYLQLTDDSFEHDDYGWDEIFVKVSDEVSSQTNADGTEKASSFLYHVVNDEIEIIKYVGVNTNIKIPAQIDGKNVTKIAKAAFSVSKVESVVFPSTVRIIGTQSFIYSPDLIDVSFADGSQLWSIDSGAFAYCEKLETVELPEGLIYLYDEAFKYCRSLESVSVPESVGIFGDRVFFSCENLVSIAFDPDIQLSSIGEYACADCSKLEQVTIPNSVQRIKDFAFYGTEIKQLDFGSNSQLTTIGALAFNTCSSLKKVVLPATLQQIGNEAFAQCFELSELVFAQDSQLATIGDFAFHNCSALTSVTLPDSINSIGQESFKSCNIFKLIIPSGVDYIGRYAFEYNQNISIFCEAETQPTDWQTNWQGEIQNIYWYSTNKPTTEGKYWHFVNDYPVIWTETDFSNMTYLAFGDSITFGADCFNGLAQMANPYPSLVKLELGLDSVANYAVNGSTIATNVDDLYSIYTQIATASSGGDIISIMGGVNDYNRNVEIGSINDVSTTTFFGSLNAICQTLKQKYPDAFIFFMTPFKEYPYQQTTCDTKNAKGYVLEDYANAIKQVCNNFDIPVLDMFTHGKYELEFAVSGSDGIHPSQEFFKNYTAPQIAQFLRDNYKN